MRVVALFRVSTAEQGERGTSLESQERRFDDMAAWHGWTAVARIRGVESASKPAEARLLLEQARRAVVEHQADAIYVHEQSRLTRGDELDVAILMRELRERGCKVIVGGIVRDPESIDERFVLRIQSAVDRMEAERIAERSRRGKRERARRGQWHTGKAPYGYVNPPVGDPNRGTLQIVPHEAAIVRRIFTAIARGVTVNALVAALNAEGIPSPRNGRWGNGTLLRLLNNPAYVGTITLRRWEHAGNVIRPRKPDAITQGAHEPIIDRRLWDAAHDRLNGRRRRGVEPAMLTGLLHINGHRATADANGQRRFYRTPGAWVDRARFDMAVWSAFRRLITSPAGCELVKQAVATAAPDNDAATLADAHRANLARLERRLDGLTSMRADGEISRAEFEDRAGRVREQIAQARSALAECERQIDRPGIDDMAATVQAMRTILRRDVPTRDRRSLIDSLVRRIDVDAIRPKRTEPWIIETMDMELRMSGLLTQNRGCRPIPLIRVCEARSPVLRLVQRPAEVIATRKTGA